MLPIETLLGWISKRGEKSLPISHLFCTRGRDRTGTSVTSLVFETNASTNSATWALYFRSTSYLACFSSKKDPKNLRALMSGKRDSNSRPRPWQGRALPTELFPLDAYNTFSRAICVCKDTTFFRNNQIFLLLHTISVTYKTKTTHSRPYLTTTKHTFLPLLDHIKKPLFSSGGKFI